MSEYQHIFVNRNPEEEQDQAEIDCRITVDDFYDLLMEQQEQM